MTRSSRIAENLVRFAGRCEECGKRATVQRRSENGSRWWCDEHSPLAAYDILQGEQTKAAFMKWLDNRGDKR